ncbi:MAG: glycosyltransferase, partial [Candidatus Vogelbacteria bacterium]|nr:glycosyltransferase [Candidatus Vogelbacteria bacterium]
MRDLIFIPTYNEKNNISFLLPEIFSAFPNIHILVIDDQSPDGTADQVAKLQKIYPRLNLLRRSVKNGLGDAYKAAYASVRGQSDIRAIITMDADGSHQIKYLKDLLVRIKDYDLVIGSRYIPGGGVENWEWWRQFLSRAGNLYSRLLTGLPIHDLTAGFICVRREVVGQIDF